MAIFLARTALLAALACAPTLGLAQDVTLSARDGALSIDGTLQAFDGEIYRILSAYGPLTLDAESVICDGPACPSLTVTKAVIRILGPAEPAARLLPPLFAAFARDRGLQFLPATGSAPAQLLDPASGQVLAEMAFAAAPPETARIAQTAGVAELVLTQAPPPDAVVRTIATDALVPIAAPDNPTPRIASTALARVLAGEVANWSEIGGPDMPLILHAMAPDTDLSQALVDRLGHEVPGAVLHATPADLARAVARDPFAIAVTSRASVGTARILDLTDSCGFPLPPSPLAVKAQDYPLALPIFLAQPPRRLPRLAREFLDFLSTPPAQAAIADSGYVNGAELRAPLADGQRLLAAIRGAGKGIALADLQALASVMDGAQRSSLTFRFDEGGATLDAASQDNLALLARLLDTGGFPGKSLILASFSDGSGAAKTNLSLSRDRADLVLQALRTLTPGLAPTALPQVLAFGAALPVACDTTPAGRRLNRRVELWLKPAFAAAAP